MTRLLRKLVPLVILAAWSNSVSAAEETQPGPIDGQFELGLFGGAFFPSVNHEWYDSNLLKQKELNGAAPDIGVRLGYMPLTFIGVELESGIVPTEINNNSSVMLWHLRGHLLAQYPARLAPFIVAGGGLEAVRSEDDVLGNDVDGVGYWGLGAKFYATDWLALRLDGRHLIGPKVYSDSVTSHFEVLAGLSVLFGGDKEEPAKPLPPGDRDRDGYNDQVDKCPREAGIAPDGCPPKDGDNDGITDDKDKCPRQAGIAPDGCPPKDGDKDGFTDDKDKCPKEPGVAPDGCPPPDGDNDGFTDDKDKCPKEPGVAPDGCPLPEAVKKFTGNIAGINFQLGKATIKANSYPLLNKAAAVLGEYKEIKLIIRGHSDSTGKREKNIELSKARADSVKAYLVKKGVSEDRLQTEGLGPDEPVADNATADGRAQNRRIEFKLDAGQPQQAPAQPQQ